MQKILFTGPESTGKTQIARQLAALFQEEWVPEYARRSLDELNRPYTEAALSHIARGQAEREAAAARRAQRWLFCDTGMLAIKVWSEYKYGRCHPWILEQLHRSRYELVFLCGIDIPWTPDPQRENPNEREELYRIFQHELKELNWPYRALWGSPEERIAKVRHFIE